MVVSGMVIEGVVKLNYQNQTSKMKDGTTIPEEIKKRMKRFGQGYEANIIVCQAAVTPLSVLKNGPSRTRMHTGRSRFGDDRSDEERI